MVYVYDGQLISWWGQYCSVRIGIGQVVGATID